MLIVGLTGGIATGKSTVSKYLSDTHQLKIVDADVIARQVVEPGTSGYNKIVDHFGPLCEDLLYKDGTLNRPALGRVIFGNEQERKHLNRIVHPAVRYESLRQVAVAWLTGHRLVVMDVPLLFESGFSNICGKTLAVVCGEETELNRLMARDAHLTEQDAKERIASQMSLDRKRELADVVIENDQELADLYHKVDEAIEAIMPWRVVAWAEWLIPPVGIIMAVITFVWRKLTAKKSKL